MATGSGHGGARENSGGARENAGRKPREVLLDIQEMDDPEAFLLAVMNDAKVDGRLRLEAARSLMPYRHKRAGGGVAAGKKEERAGAAEKAATGRLAPTAAPKLHVAK